MSTLCTIIGISIVIFAVIVLVVAMRRVLKFDLDAPLFETEITITLKEKEEAKDKNKDKD